MNLFIYASFLGHSWRIEDEPFTMSTRNKFQPHIRLFTKYPVLYNNWMWNAFRFLQKKKKNLQNPYN